MRYRSLAFLWLGAVLFLSLGLGAAPLALAQRVPHATATADPAPAPYPARTATNLFATLDVTSGAYDGLRIDLPPGWRLDGVTLLRFGAEPVPHDVRTRAGASGRYVVEPRRPLQGPHEIVLSVTTGAPRASATWSLVPLMQNAFGELVPQEGKRLSRRVAVAEAPRAAAAATGESANRALRLDGRGPVLLRRDALPVIGAASSFTVEAWLRTTDLDAVVFSTWDGDERHAYPLEVVTDASGRLRFYAGQPGRHHALTSRTPVADGFWHHVAVTYDAEAQRTRLFLGGEAVDSLLGVRLPNAPRPRPLGLGGRPDEDRPAAEAPAAAFDGWLDEVRLWPVARPPEALRQTMRRSLDADPPAGRPSAAARFVNLTFEADLPSRLLADTAREVVRLPADLPLRAPLRDLRAATTATGDVRLAWTCDTRAETAAFVVERSPDGRRFAPVERLAPARTAGRDPSGRTAQYAFIDENAEGQVLYYRIRQVFDDGTERVTPVLKIGRGATGGTSAADAPTRLIGNFPNPFDRETTIAYEVGTPAPVAISVWDLTGHRIVDLVDEPHAPGYYELPFVASNLPSGTYFVRMQTPDGVQSDKMVLLK